MTARLRSGWQKIKQGWVAIVVAITILVIIALIFVCIRFDVTGFNGYTQVSTIHTLSGPTAGTVTRTETYQSGKTLWDWMQLLFVPVVLAVAGFWFNHRERKAAELRVEADREIEQQRAEADRRVSIDNQREAALKEYIDKMSELLLHENLSKSEPESEVRKIARVLTLTTLQRLDGSRKRSVLQFLYESKLIGICKPIIALINANLSETDLTGANLSETDLSGVSLIRADLREASLVKANLCETDLRGAKLSEANLCEADLRGAKLSGTNFVRADLSKANLTSADLSEIYPNLYDIIEAYLIRGEVSTNRPNKFQLRGANLSDANLTDTNLSNANLAKVNLNGANLSRANLYRAGLVGADLSGTNLSEANLSEAYLQGAIGITIEELKKQAKSLKGATMPDGSKHP